MALNRPFSVSRSNQKNVADIQVTPCTEEFVEMADKLSEECGLFRTRHPTVLDVVLPAAVPDI